MMSTLSLALGGIAGAVGPKEEKSQRTTDEPCAGCGCCQHAQPWSCSTSERQAESL
jgi:hypothetical protein